MFYHSYWWFTERVLAFAGTDDGIRVLIFIKIRLFTGREGRKCKLKRGKIVNSGFDEI